MNTPLLDENTRDAFKQRVRTLKADTRGTWGKMTVDQMLHHVNTSMAESLGEYQAARTVRGVPEWLVRFAILYGPWGKGAPTRRDMKVPEGDRYDFVIEQARLLDMIDRFCTKHVDGEWPRSANFAMTGRHWRHLEGRHLDHHLRQFGA